MATATYDLDGSDSDVDCDDQESTGAGNTNVTRSRSIRVPQCMASSQYPSRDTRIANEKARQLIKAMSEGKPICTTAYVDSSRTITLKQFALSCLACHVSIDRQSKRDAHERKKIVDQMKVGMRIDRNVAACEHGNDRQQCLVCRDITARTKEYFRTHGLL